MEVIALTDKAQVQAKTLLDDQGSEQDGLRVAVKGGGCSGFQYKIGFDVVSESDATHQYDNGLTVMVDQKSATLLEGCSLEFHNEIERMGFEVVNPGACSTCGCGKSFSS